MISSTLTMTCNFVTSTASEQFRLPTFIHKTWITFQRRRTLLPMPSGLITSRGHLPSLDSNPALRVGLSQWFSTVFFSFYLPMANYYCDLNPQELTDFFFYLEIVSILMKFKNITAYITINKLIPLFLLFI